MKPRPTPDLTGDNARKLIEYAEKPLSRSERTSLQRCRKIFENAPVKYGEDKSGDDHFTMHISSPRRRCPECGHMMGGTRYVRVKRKVSK